MKISIKRWLTPEGYSGIVLKDEVFSRALKIELELELSTPLAEAVDRLSGITEEAATWDFNKLIDALADIAEELRVK